MTDLVLNFAAGSWTGWGVLGMNLLGLLADDPDYNVLAGMPILNGMFMSMDPLHYAVLDRIAKRSKEWEYTDDCIWIDSVGNDLRPLRAEGPNCHIGRVIIEKPDTQHAMENLNAFTHLLTGSTWNKELIEDISGRKARCILEGIDPSIFCPGPKSGWLPEGFYIYACGKLEYRKAQDIVLRAFKTFSERHSDARLVTLWNSPFADLGNGYKGTLDHPIWMKDNGFLDVKRWAHDNGIDENKVLELGCVPNWTLPSVLREMDVMLSPSRVESCTSLPVMEAMAVGVPIIAPLHSGLTDLLTHDNSFPLVAHKPIRASSEYFFPRSDFDWYECDLDEILAQLEWVYQNRTLAKMKANRASRWIRSERTWAKHVIELKAWLDYIGGRESKSDERIIAR